MVKVMVGRENRCTHDRPKAGNFFLWLGGLLRHRNSPRKLASVAHADPLMQIRELWRHSAGRCDSSSFVTAAMAENTQRSRVFLDVSIGTEPIGRLVFELYADKAPKTCEK